MSVIVLASCSTKPTADPASTTTTTSVFSHAQVLSWVTPTLSNGISFLQALPPGATATQVESSAQPLRIAVSVSLHELTQVTWRGSLQKDENRLVVALMSIEIATAKAPETDYLAKLDLDILRAQEALRALNRVVNR
jgi:hypothetical protein